jgi:hypothetical protein
LKVYRDHGGGYMAEMPPCHFRFVRVADTPDGLGEPMRFWALVRGGCNPVGVDRPFRTLREAKARAAQCWIRNRLGAICDLASGNVAELEALCKQAYTFDDEVLPAVLRDWLHEHNMDGHLLHMIIQPGKKAGLIWPRGWDVLAAAKEVLV